MDKMGLDKMEVVVPKTVTGVHLRGGATLTLAIATIVLAVILAAAAPGFLSVYNLVNVLRQISLTSIMAVGFGVVAMTGGMDISMGNVAALVGMFLAALIAYVHVDLPLAIILALLLGALIGTINGVLVAYLKVPSFIGTLAMFFIAQGVNFQTTNGFPIFEGLTPSLLFLGQGHVLGIPMPVVIAALVFLAMHFFLQNTVYGQHIYAIGGNEESARVTGVDVGRVKVTAYVIAGLCAALTGIVITARLGTAQPAAAGMDFFLTAVTAAVLGGVSLSGGEGNMTGIAIGALFLGILNNGLTLLHVSSYSQWTITGILLIASIIWNTVQRSRQGGGYGN